MSARLIEYLYILKKYLFFWQKDGFNFCCECEHIMHSKGIFKEYSLCTYFRKEKTEYINGTKNVSNEVYANIVNYNGNCKHFVKRENNKND